MTGNHPMGCASCRPVGPAMRGVERMSTDDDHLDAKSMNARRMSTSMSTSTSVTREGCAEDDVEDDDDDMRGTPNSSTTGASRGERRRSDAWWLFHGGGFGSGAGLDDDEDDGGMDARIGSAVMDIVPRRDGGETRRRIEMEHEEVMRRHFNAADDADAGEVVRRLGETRPKSKSKMASKTTSKTIQELVRDARETTRRTWTHVRVTTSRGARVVGRALEATASRGSALVEESGRAARFAAREEHRRTVIATARHGARVVVREVSGIKVKIEPIVRVTFDKYVARELGWRLRAAFAASRLGRIFQRRRRGGKRERMKKREKNAPSTMEETEVDVASPEHVYMRDLMGMFEAARGIDPDEFIELLSPQSLTTNAGDMPVVRAEDSSVPTPETVEILAQPVDVSRVESEGYFGSYSEDSFSDTVDEHLPASASALAAHGVQSSDVAMSPDPEAKSFVRRIEDDLEALSESEGYSSRILSVDDVTLGAQVLRAWRSALSPGGASAASAASPPAVDGARLFDDDDEAPVEISRLDVSETNIAVVTPAQDVSTPDQQRAQRVFSFISDSDEFEQLLDAVTPSSELSALEARAEPVEEENAAFVESTFEEQRAVSAPVEESISSPQQQVVDEAPSAAPDAVREQTDAFGLELARLQEDLAKMRDEQANMSKAAVERESELRRSFEVERQRIIDSSKASVPEQSNEIKLLREELERVKQAQESRVSEPIPETKVSERELAEIATLKREIEQLKKAQETRASDASKASVPEQSAEIALLKEALDRMKQSQKSIMESAVARERELKETFEKERREFEKSLKESLAAERIELEQELNKSIALERGGLEEQLHQGDEYLGNEIQQIQAELSAVKANQESASKQLVGAGALSVATPEPPRFALDTETDVSMEWDLYQLKEELDKVKTEQTSALLLTASRDEELRKSLSTERLAIQDAIREEVSRHLGQIEMQSVNAALQVDLRASRAEKLLSGAEKIMEETERKLQQRERQLLANAEGVVARAEDRLKRREAELKALAATPPPRSPFSNSTPSSSTTNLHILEQARARRRLLHEVTDTFSIGDIVSQARQLAEDIEYSFGQ
jgi:hypothetical protein